MESTLERQKEHQDALSKISPTLQSASLARIPPKVSKCATTRQSYKGTHGSEIVYSSVMAITFRNPHGHPMALGDRGKNTAIARQSHVGCSCHGLFKVLSKYRAAGS